MTFQSLLAKRIISWMHVSIRSFVHYSIEWFCTIRTAVVYSFLFIRCLIHALSRNFPKCSKKGLRRRPQTTLKANTPAKCRQTKILLRSFDHILASSCMGSLLQRHKFIQTFLLSAHAVKHMSVKCFYVKNVPNLIPKWTQKGPPEGPQNQPKWRPWASYVSDPSRRGPGSPKPYKTNGKHPPEPVRQEGRKAQCNYEVCSHMARFIALSIAFIKVSCLLACLLACWLRSLDGIVCAYIVFL